MMMILNQSTSFTMPIITRDIQFQWCFKEFMDSTSDLYYPDLKEWSLKSLTENKSSSIHQYQLKVPAKSVIYTIDPHTDPITGLRQPGAVVQGDQEIPEIHDFSDKFQVYFDKYNMKSHGVIVSYTSIGSVVKTDQGELSARIMVRYYKSYLPYPSKKKTDDQIRDRCIFLEGENTILNETLFDLNSLNNKQRKDIKQLKKRIVESNVESILKTREIIDKMERKIKEYYKELNRQDDCPVCYECIKSEELVTPGCCHYICGKCYDRCDICPICRDKYD